MAPDSSGESLAPLVRHLLAPHGTAPLRSIHAVGGRLHCQLQLLHSVPVQLHRRLSWHIELPRHARMRRRLSHWLLLRGAHCHTCSVSHTSPRLLLQLLATFQSLLQRPSGADALQRSCLATGVLPARIRQWLVHVSVALVSRARPDHLHRQARAQRVPAAPSAHCRRHRHLLRVNSALLAASVVK
jgi:hypothetical protein